MNATTNLPFVLVCPSEIQFAHRPEVLEELNSLQFINPRRFQGFDSNSMSELRESIRQNGLLEPIVVRKIEKDGELVYQVVAGERRKRCIDDILEENTEVFDRRTNSFRPASEVYDRIYCHLVENCDDETALKLAFTENANSVPLSEADVIDLCDYLVNGCNFQRKKVSALLGKSEPWLSQSLSFKSRLPEKAYECLRNGMIPRIVGTRLLGYEKDDRLNLLQEAINIAIEKAEEAVKEAEKALEEVKSDLTTSELEAAEKALETARTRAKNVRVTESDLDDAADKHNRTIRSAKSLSTKQIKKFYVEKLEELVGETGDSGFVVYQDKKISLDYLEFAKLIAKSIISGQRNPLEILVAFAEPENPEDSND